MIKDNTEDRQAARQLTRIRIIHTVIWVFFNFLMAYLIYAVVMDRISIWVWISLGCFLLEGIVLLIFKNYCPLTVWARRYSVSTKDNFDIYLPNWLARYNKLIYTSLLVMVIVVLVYRLL